MIFDMPALTDVVILRTLNITGYLMFPDDPDIGDIELSAQYIVVHGVLTIGSPSQHYR